MHVIHCIFLVSGNVIIVFYSQLLSAFESQVALFVLLLINVFWCSDKREVFVSCVEQRMM